MPPLARIGIISIGQMGLGISHLLTASNYQILTNISDRSAATQSRAKEASITLVLTDIDLVAQSDYIFSIVPPRDAIATATRIVDAFSAIKEGRKGREPLYYLDLNAIAPSTARKIEELIRERAPSIRFIDGGIIGGPPSPPSNSSGESPAKAEEWTRPGVPLSGPHTLASASISGAHLAATLNTLFLDSRIGTASGLKCSFAALSKGFTALALQSFTTASNLGCCDALEHYLDRYIPGAKAKAGKSIVGCPPKAYRWVEEMNQIGLCFTEDGGWSHEANVFGRVAGVYGELAQVVEKRGGTEGMGELDGAIAALRKGLKEGKITKDELEKLIAE
ncbi:6-phosphogluconate dehydrogenase C-terminal domain-like protein [Lentithecium fluviatile CBS 122367]|uniref:6-phosphogluconate dehydrogenase C-terminal domain-like protein n=1 Tax=Lentithecium fluviatile CBS 122367 TaxID=1168545 RepID=A0A6G1JMU3_9PLEO|nr:6-phosphogluconate dehydrogenase C-terminal domain-like protein [Lentithecium fluviatile CBS 122367]